MVEKEEGVKELSGEKQKMSDFANISLKLNYYEDIFSSFDSRTYSQKALSHDLLGELKRATRETTAGGLQVTFIIPREKRNWEHEIIIKRRLREHFKKHYIESVQDVKKLKFRGYGMALLGVALIFISSLLYSIEDANLFIKFLMILLEPAGWFTAWTGLEDVYYTGREMKEELDFHEKMSNSDIQFVSV